MVKTNTEKILEGLRKQKNKFKEFTDKYDKLHDNNINEVLALSERITVLENKNNDLESEKTNLENTLLEWNKWIQNLDDRIKELELK